VNAAVPTSNKSAAPVQNPPSDESKVLADNDIDTHAKNDGASMRIRTR
jgi:hypothetical protein